MAQNPVYQRSDETSRSSDARLRPAIEIGLDAVVTIDTNGVLTGWSPQAERTFGWTRHEALGQQLAGTIVPRAARDEHRRGLEQLLAADAAEVPNRRVETVALHRSGREFPVELSIARIDSSDSVSFSVVIRDLTDRSQAEQNLIEGQHHYQALAESLPNMVWTCRPDGRCDFLSRQWLEYTGRPEEEQLGYGWAELVHADDRERVRATWSEATGHGKPYDVEFRIRRADGVYRWFKTRAVPLRNSAGEIVKWFGSNTDFQDNKESEQHLEAQLERLSLLDRVTRAIGERQDLESILRVVIHHLEEHLPVDFCCVCLHDRLEGSLVVTTVGIKSGTLAASIGMHEEARVTVDQHGLSGCMQAYLVHEPDLRRVPFPFPQQLARAGLGSLVAAPLLVEGSVFGILISARRQAEGFSSGDCEFLRQLSEHVALAVHQAQLHSALRQAYDDLRQTQQAVMQQERLKAFGQMASGIAHDINNAISPITLYAEWLLENPSLNAEAKGYLATIQRAIDDVARTVGRMKEFYRSREPELLLQPVDVNGLVEEVLQLTQAKWHDLPQKRGVVIQTSLLLARDAPSIMGVFSELCEALINLVFNAVDAMPDGGTLTVRTVVTEESSPSNSVQLTRRLSLEVTDTGMGMSAETRHRCLEPFFTTKGERGTGLGLAMVYGITQRHGADLRIESVVGHGTTVRLIFTVPTTAGAPPIDATPVSPASARRILVVDDDPLLLKSLRDTLESDGHLVTGADSGQTGIEAFRAARESRSPFALVITDLGMPGMDGRQVATKLKGVSPDTPVILLTGWGHLIMDDDEEPSHVDYVLSKPPKLSELRRILANLTPPGPE